MAYRLRGVAKIELAKHAEIDTAISQMNEGLNDIIKAKTMCIGQDKQEYEDELTHWIFIAKKIIYYKESEQNENFLKELNSLL